MSEEELAKDLGPLAALTIGVGTMIGAGIFVLPGDAISTAGSLAVLSFVVGGAIALLTALSASELGTAMPRSGGAYYYVNHALGPLFGSIAGWANWLGLAFASAFYMVGFGQYIGRIAGVAGTVGVGPVTVDVVSLIALAGGTFFVGVNYVGAKETGRLQNVIVLILIAILTVFTLVGGFQADVSNLPKNEGLTPMLTATGFIFVSYLGFVQITSVAEEIKDPGKNLPRAVIGSVVLVTGIYALVLFVMSATVEPGFIAGMGENEIAVVQVAERLLGPVGAVAMLFGGLLATASSANASILASSRINFAMGRDRVISPDLNRVHPRFSTPYRSIAITGGLMLSFIIGVDLVGGNAVTTLSGLASFLHLIIYGLLNVSLIVMRVTDPPDYNPDFRVPLSPITPALGAITSFALIYYIEPMVTAFGAAIVAWAVIWYAGYARERSLTTGVLRKYLREPRLTDGPGEDMPDDDKDYRILVPLANPEHETELISLASAIARQRGGTVVATHIVTVPDQTSLEYGAEHIDQLDAESESLLETAQQDATTHGVPVETHTILSHRSFGEIFDAAKTHDADLIVMGWGPDSHGAPGRAEGALDEITEDVPCDTLVFRNRGFDPAKILVPTAGGPDSELSAATTALLEAEYDSDVTLLHVAEDRAEGEAFLEEWAADRGLEDATLRVETGDIESAIIEDARDATLVVVGATERGLLDRLVRGSVLIDAIEDVECSVLMAERKRDRSLWERLFG
ncbi:amino acid permease [Halorhabdus sp. CBA1104]|uniref:amino acid permease n=1 Tax=Halorhabdus sp. CBA1104 TaxID=1380432 RepID=UPI0012B3BA9F|nr:amino acid permease [Halorhabdus sp. CBA1104]QGN08149.1 amino acid permease [Halorhabdus sp. CBA1104]